MEIRAGTSSSDAKSSGAFLKLKPQSLLWLSIAAAIAFTLKIALAINTYGAIDIMTWERDLTKIETEGVWPLYRDGIPYVSAKGVQTSIQPFIHPPFMVHVLRFWGLLARISGWPMRFWLRFTSSLVDLVSILLILKILEIRRPNFPNRTSLLLLALCPVSLLVSGFHGNTDPIMISLVLFSIYLLEIAKPAWWAGAALGLAVSVKLAPLIFAPAILLYLRGPKKRLQFVMASTIIFLIACSPYVFQHPTLILTKIFGYGSAFGNWGLSRALLPLWINPQFESFRQIYEGYGKFALILAAVIAALWMNSVRQKSPVPLMLQCGFTAFLFMVLTPGFGVQYLVWLVPWTTLLTVRQALAFHTASAMFLFVYYNRSAHGLPWYFANSAGIPVWYGTVIYFGLLCWIVVVVNTIAFAHRVRRCLAA
jgi:hypothetical protein